MCKEVRDLTWVLFGFCTGFFFFVVPVHFRLHCVCENA
jgi:hypothetical protein